MTWRSIVERIDQRTDPEPRGRQYRPHRQRFRTAFRFRVLGDTIGPLPSGHYGDRAWRVNLFGDEVESIEKFDPSPATRAMKLEFISLCIRITDTATDAVAGDLPVINHDCAGVWTTQRRRPPALRRSALDTSTILLTSK